MNDTTHSAMHDAVASAGRPRRDGTTLLEVLVACGILVIGLASVAALLPAAASVLAEASITDRGGTLAANAAADLELRRLLKASEFGANARTVMLASSGLTLTLPGIKRINVEPRPIDEQAYGSGWYMATATPLALEGPVRRGDPARLTVAAFKRIDAEGKPIQLTRFSTDGVFQITGGNQEADRKRFLPSCGWAIALVDGEVHWLHVGSSWATYEPGGKIVRDSFVSFSDPEAAAAASNGNQFEVYGLAGVVRVEEKIIPLD